MAEQKKQRVHRATLYSGGAVESIYSVNMYTRPRILSINAPNEIFIVCVDTKEEARQTYERLRIVDGTSDGCTKCIFYVE